ncbi:hypothetical protein M9458_042692, partial [Cirrhinus mrigala]
IAILDNLSIVMHKALGDTLDKALGGTSGDTFITVMHETLGDALSATFIIVTE